MSRKHANKRMAKSKRIAFVSPAIAETGNYRRINMEIADNVSKTYRPHKERINTKGLYEYVKPRFGIIIKRKYYKVGDLK